MYVHCFAHSLNLAIQDLASKCQLVKDVLDTIQEITKLVKYSPKRESWLNTIKERDVYEEDRDEADRSIGIKLLCRTRLAENPLLICT